jgi:DNA-binding response OmpR family regulator
VAGNPFRDLVRENLKFQKGGAVEKILCVDDDLSLLHLYQDELTEEGFKVILAKNGKEALSKFMKEKPHVGVMDFACP